MNRPVLPVRIGMAQMRVDFSQPHANMTRACEMISRAAAAKCNIVILPEAMDIGWPCVPSAGLAEPIPGPRCAVLAEAAKRHGMYVLSGVTELAGGNIYNAAVLFSPLGQILHVHRKINVLVDVEDVYATGDRLGVVQTPFGTVGIDICADSCNRIIPHALCRMGANMILSPSAWVVPPDYDNQKTPYGQTWLDAYQEISRLYGVAFVGVSNVGPVTYGAWNGWRCIGCSLGVGPDGAVLAQGPYGVTAEELLCIEFQARPAFARGTAWTEALKQKGYVGP